VVVPAGEARNRVVEEAHDSPYSEHFGKHKVLHQINQNFWWPGWRKDVESYVFGCLVCQRNKAQTVKKAGLLQSLSVPSFKWESVSMNFITQLPVTKKGYDDIAVFVDRLSKIFYFAPTYTDCSAIDIARLFNDTVFKHHGLPSELILDRDPRFTSKFWTELTRLLGTKLKMSTAFHPQTNGQTERSNRVLEDYLRHYISPSQNDWDEWLPQAEFSVNNAWQELISDRDPRFTSKFWTELTRLLGTKLKMSSAFHPQTNGQTERSNRFLEDYLRHYISPSQDDWDEWLPRQSSR
jgi:hypothetical protein